jgi:hypothetical protein
MGVEIERKFLLEDRPAQFEALWPLTARRRLAKRRQRVPLEDGSGGVA